MFSYIVHFIVLVYGLTSFLSLIKVRKIYNVQSHAHNTLIRLFLAGSTTTPVNIVMECSVISEIAAVKAITFGIFAKFFVVILLLQSVVSIKLLVLKNHGSMLGWELTGNIYQFMIL